MREKAKVDFDRKRKHLIGFEVGANVYCQDFKTKRWSRKETITRTTKRKRTYQVKIDGRKFWRNVKFLRRDPEYPEESGDPDDPVADRPKSPKADRNILKKLEVPQLRRSTRTRKRTQKSLSTY